MTTELRTAGASERGNWTTWLRTRLTRMVPPGQALVGDFAMAAKLLDGGRSVIRVAEPPPGTFAGPGTAVCAEIWEGLAVQLPTHFYLTVPADAPPEQVR